MSANPSSGFKKHPDHRITTRPERLAFYPDKVDSITVT